MRVKTTPTVLPGVSQNNPYLDRKFYSENSSLIADTLVITLIHVNINPAGLQKSNVSQKQQ